ncbi:MAG: beta-N-acetylhexosaminidase [Lachnospiraceae bacterium]|nr:beta-N-acetylhexosaminidase [Lachnospiraceae bacterium]
MNTMTELHLVPYPAEVSFTEGSFFLPEEGSFSDKTEDSLYRSCLPETVRGVCWILPKTEQEGDAPEGSYRLSIRPEGLEIEGTEQGIFYAGQTLRQLLVQFGGELPCLEIRDWPRFAYRGFMLDSSRHFLPKEDVKKLLDAAAAMRLNKFHWHLTDDQGWRIEISKHPELTGKGARRGRAMFADLPEPEESAGYFSREDIREIISYAAERFIDIVPELEIPGHESALLFSCPELRCENADGEPKVQINGGIFKELLCAGNEKTYPFIEEILDEYMELFPYPYIHLGGDEAVKAHWRSCPRCQAKMHALGLKDENAMQQWMVRCFADYLRKHGRHAVVWNEVLRGEALPTDIVVQMWHGDADLGGEFAERGGRIIHSSTDAYYLDYPYFVTDVSKILNFDPVPEYLKNSEQSVFGIEAPLWTERVVDLDRAAFQLFPRLPAVAERAWSPEKACGPDTFFSRYTGLQGILEEMGLRGAPEKYWKISEADKAEEFEEYERITKTPHMLRFIEEQERVLQEEIRVYGRF